MQLCLKLYSDDTLRGGKYEVWNREMGHWSSKFGVPFLFHCEGVRHILTKCGFVDINIKERSIPIGCDYSLCEDCLHWAARGIFADSGCEHCTRWPAEQGERNNVAEPFQTIISGILHHYSQTVFTLIDNQRGEPGQLYRNGRVAFVDKVVDEITQQEHHVWNQMFVIPTLRYCLLSKVFRTVTDRSKGTL